MSRHGRLPDFAQRRLDALIEKRKNEGLTRAERRELTDSLEYIEDTSIELLAYAAEHSRQVQQSRCQSDRSRSPLWKRYIDRRLKQLCSR
jgi:hypothetical protein